MSLKKRKTPLTELWPEEGNDDKGKFYKLYFENEK